MRLGRLLLLGVIALSAAFLAFILPKLNEPQRPEAQAQTSPSTLAAFEIEILPGTGSGNLRMTSGWHGDRYGGVGLDIAAAADDDVHVRFNAVKTHRGIHGFVNEIVHGNGKCHRMQITILDVTFSAEGLPLTMKELGFLQYYHVNPEVGRDDDDNPIYLKLDASINFQDDETPTKLGLVVDDVYDSCNGGDHLHQSAVIVDSTTPWGTANLWANKDRDYRDNDDGLGFDLLSAGYGAPETRFCASTWMFKLFPHSHPSRTIDQWAPHATNIAKCAASDAPEDLVADGDGSSISLTWTNQNDGTITEYLYRIREASDVFPDGSGRVTGTVSYPGTDVYGNPIYDSHGNRVLHYGWAAACTVTDETTADEKASWVSDLWGFQLTTRTAAVNQATDWYQQNCDWTPIPSSDRSTVSHTISTGLQADTDYVVQVRARNGDHLSDRGGIATVEATTSPKCTVTVTIQDAGGNALSVDGVDVPGGGEGECGTRTLMVELTNANYDFTSWTVAAATGLTSNCGSASTTCALTFGTGEGDATTAAVTATFTRRQPSATLALSSTSIAENRGSSTVSATLSSPALVGGASLTVGASGGSGYRLSTNKTLTFAAGATSSSGTVTITARHDADTDNETVTVSATVAGGAITAPASVTLTIRDDDVPPSCDDGTPPPCEDDDGDTTCTGNTVWNSTTMMCEACTGGRTAVNNQCVCTGNTEWNSTTMTCEVTCTGGRVPDANGNCVCTGNTVWNSTTMMCEVTCTGGRVPDANGNCVCTGNTVWNSTTMMCDACAGGKTPVGGQCVCPSDTEEVGGICMAPCTGGKVRDTNGQCVCPSGQEENDAGVCVVPTFGWSGVCYDAAGTTGGGTGLSQSAATAAGQAFKAACSAGGVTTTVTGTTFWYATVTCTSGTSFTLGPFSTSGAADTAGGLGVSTCGLGRLRFNLPTDGPLTLAQVRAALATALSELSAPLTLDDLTPPEIPVRETADPPGRAGGFSTHVASDGQYADVTCENGTTFTVGPAATLEAVLADGLLGLKVCANGGALAELSLPESGTVTRAQLESAITAALSQLPTPLTMDDLEAPPSGRDSSSARSVQARNGSFSTWSSTSWSWTASCNAGGGSGAGSANTESAAVNAIQLWVGSANCPAGGGTYSVFKE